ncbi:MAG: VOC family protein [Streptococcaceae bacterium]|nr:VOC family protein [Streptococcaceae bacterium]
MIETVPMLRFNHNCQEALNVYQQAFDAQLLVKMTYADANVEDVGKIDEAQKELIYHAQLKIGNTRFILFDAPGENSKMGDMPKTAIIKGNQTDLVMIFKTDEEVRRAYDFLSKKAITLGEIKSTTYSSSTVSLTDKFGINWDLMTYFE